MGHENLAILKGWLYLMGLGQILWLVKIEWSQIYH